ncbi:hypothetical protein SAMN05421812_101186 [Asanoa hainanensis]|uniref:Thioredoxin domain-containing protein n=1 Tax=Asanoa hainanensis TaxID=560556 RepID=A0A239G1C9_9ACTN|nr:hypothetical protein [Asanoa hainanensis]SNS63067.1 hypothetical protein SAMN05421812_101186 [Asanoa hainanensis]
MEPWIAVAIVTWVALLLLLAALGSVVRDLRLLRGQVDQSAAQFAATRVALRMPNLAGVGTRIVLAGESGCPLCVAAALRAAGVSAAAQVPVTLLTHEAADSWADVPTGALSVVSDPESWQVIGHLSPPVLLLLSAEGDVQRLVLPVDTAEVDRVLSEWSTTLRRGRIDVGEHSTA